MYGKYRFRHGGWILDNFPNTRDIWAAYLERGGERGILPDDVIYLTDDSEQHEFLMNRWFQLNKVEIMDKVNSRLQAEAEEKRRKEEVARYFANNLIGVFIFKLM